MSEETCTNCHGTGLIDDETDICPRCSGQGIVIEPDTEDDSEAADTRRKHITLGL